MKLSIISLCLVTLAFVAGSNAWKTQCGATVCGEGQVCVCRDGVSNCVLLSDCGYVAVVNTAERSWVENGMTYTLFRCHIVNYGYDHLSQMTIGTDCTLDIKDGSIWNIEVHGNDLVLPAYSNGIDGQKTYTFGFILRGNQSPNMFIKSMTF
eukprot:gene5240-6063_t